jgi:hypothetical protein
MINTHGPLGGSVEKTRLPAKRHSLWMCWGKSGLEPHVHKPELILVKSKLHVITAVLILLQLRIAGFFKDSAEVHGLPGNHY